MSARLGGRLWFPVFVAILVFAPTLWLYETLRAQDEAHLNQRVAVEASRKASELRSRIESTNLMLVQMARRWITRGTPPRFEWQADAEQYVAQDSAYQALEWVSSSLIIRWVVPREGNESDIDFDVRRDPLRLMTLKSALTRGEPAVSPSFELSGRRVLALSVPLRIDNLDDGFIMALVKVDPVLKEVLAEVEEGYFTYEVKEKGETLLYPRSSVGAYRQLHFVAVHGLEWHLSVFPTPEFLKRARSRVPELMLLLGSVTSVLLALSLGLARTSHVRARQLEAGNLNLEREVGERRRAEEEAVRQQSIIRDSITERRRAEEEIRRLNLDLERRVEERTAELRLSNEELQRFAYVASHDLQEPLRAISSFTQLLARRYRGKLDSDADEFIGFAVDGCSRMQALINDLLAYSRIGTGGSPFEVVDSGAALDAALANLRFSIQEAGARLDHGSMPALKGDATQLTQLFQNLVGNAIKFRREETPEVKIGAERGDGMWDFSIADNGLGIEPRFAERIFVIFQRLHRRDEYPGTGIGLAICKKIVERHGGRIWVESTPGQGSTFRFTLPALSPDPAPEDEGEPQA